MLKNQGREERVKVKADYFEWEHLSDRVLMLDQGRQRKIEKN